MAENPQRTQESPVDDRLSSPQFRHVIISCAYRGQAVPNPHFTGGIEAVLEDHDGVAPEAIVTYSSPYFGMPNRLAVREVWIGMTDEDRQKMFDQFPQLTAAILLLFFDEKNEVPR